MRKFNAFVLALALATAFIAGPSVAGEKKKYPGLWSKYESLPVGSKCFVVANIHATIFCPYDSGLIAQATTIGTSDLPPAAKRIYLQPTGANIKLSQKQ